MDKNTLSEYGWIIISIILLAVMLAVAEPVGQMVNKGLTSVANDFFPAETESVQLNTPSVSIKNNVMTICGDSRSDEFKIYVDGALLDTVSEGEIDLSDYSWGSGEYAIKVVALGSGYKASDPSAELLYRED